jgi:hypothetical protein
MTSYDPEKVTFFAKTDARGKEVSFGIKAKDRQRHMYVVGKTGMGKSTLLENMAAQDLQNGEGIAFIDPHGSAAETLLEYVPEHRVKDVVYFAPFDLDHPVSFNVMEDVGPDKRHLVVSGLMSTFKKIWVDAWSARMEYILTNALLALIEYPDTTLLSVNRLFVDKAYRKKVVEYIKDPAVKAFWTDEFANYTDRFAAEALPAIQNKIGQFTGNPLIRNIIGQPHSSFDIRKLMDEKKILIMNLSKGLIGETNANLLGSMLTTRIYLAAMSRADLPVAEMKQMPNFYFYVDEFQSFANATFANILSEARKYHLNLIIAHQYIEQMEEDVRNAVFGNVGTSVAFRVGPFDAEVLETVFAPRFEATDLVNLGFAQIYLTLMIDGIGSQPFSAQTLPPIAQPPVSCRQMVIEQSRKLYASKREDVEKLVDELHTPKKPEHPKPQNGKPGNQNFNNQKKPEYNTNRKPTSTPTTTTAQRTSLPVQAIRPRQEFKHKTPDDLRQVLSKMTAATVPPSKPKPELESKSELESKPKPKTIDTEKPKTQQNETQKKAPPQNTETKKPHQTAEKNKSVFPANQKPYNNRDHKKVQATEKTSDLKQALADVLQQAQKQQNSQVQGEKPTVKKDVQAEQHNKTAFNKRTQQKHRHTPVREDSAIEKDKKQDASVSTSHELTFAARRQQQLVTHAQESVSAEVQKDTPKIRIKKPQPQTEKNTLTTQPKNNLDAAEIRRMLRQSDNERSPFN